MLKFKKIQNTNCNARNCSAILCLTKMVTRRFTQLPTSDDEDDYSPLSKPHSTSTNLVDDNTSNRRKRKVLNLQDDDDEEEASNDKKMKLNGDDDDEEEEEEASSEEEESPLEDAKPVGGPVRVSGKGRGRKSHFQSFEFDNNLYTLVYHLSFYFYLLCCH